MEWQIGPVNISKTTARTHVQNQTNLPADRSAKTDI